MQLLGGLLNIPGFHAISESEYWRMAIIVDRRAQRPRSADLNLAEKYCSCQGKISRVMQANNIAPKEVREGFPCIVLRTLPIPQDRIERGLIIGYAIGKDTIGGRIPRWHRWYSTGLSYSIARFLRSYQLRPERHR